MSDRSVSMVIVNYNSGDYLPQCLKSVIAQDFTDFEVIVIDNASTDNSLEFPSQFEQIRVVRNDTNVGFARAQNQGMRLAQGKYLMPLNFDLTLNPTFLEKMIDAINMSENIGSVSGKLLNMGPNGEPTNTIYSVGHLLPRNRFPLLRGQYETDDGRYDLEEYVFGTSGAAPLYRKEMLDDVAFNGQFYDETFFTWYEDVDLDWRAQLRGWKCLYTPHALAYHRGHPEGYREPLRSFRASITIRNRWMMVLANECGHCMLRNFVPLLFYELSLLKYVVTAGLTGAYLRAIRSFLALLPHTLAKRRWNQSRAVQKHLDC